MAARWLTELSAFSVEKASQLRAKSDQWFADTEFLFKSKRWASCVYLGGFVIELLLKSELWAQRNDPVIRKLLYSSHDLDQLRLACRRIDAKLSSPLENQIGSRFESLASWSVRIRYNPKIPSAGDAKFFMIRLKEVRKWLIGTISLPPN